MSTPIGTLTTTEEARLIHSYRSGDRSAGEAIYLQYHEFVRSIANKLAVPNSYLNEELYQVGLLAMFKSAVANYDINKNFRFTTFLEVCARRAMLNYLNRVHSKDLLIGDIRSRLRDDSYGSVELNTETLHDRYVLQQLMAQINQHEALIVSLTYEMGFTVKETGKLLGLPERRIAYLLRRGLLNLRRRWSELQ